MIDPWLPGKYLSSVFWKVLEHKNYFFYFYENLSIKGRKIDSILEFSEVDYSGIGFFSLRNTDVTSL